MAEDGPPCAQPAARATVTLAKIIWHICRVAMFSMFGYRPVRSASSAGFPRERALSPLLFGVVVKDHQFHMSDANDKRH